MKKAPDIFKALDSLYTLPRNLHEHLEAILLSKEYPKGHLLLRPGQVPSAVWYIQRGSARAYVFDDRKGEQISTWFWYPGDFLLVLDSFCRQLPTSFYIELLEDCHLMYINYASLEQTAERFPVFRHVERHIMEVCLHRVYGHYHARAHLPAKARYEMLMHEHPYLFQVASVRDIASFLGMFPDTLSRLRSEK